MKILQLLFTLVPIFIFSQIKISGKITDENKTALSNVHLYIDGSTYQTTSNKNGEFVFDLPSGQYNLIIKHLNFETKYLAINTKNNKTLEIILIPEVINLSEAVIAKVSKEDRKFYLQEFKRLFLGSNNAAKKTKILNENDLRFSYNKADKVLKVNAKKPLVIKNNYLGYTINYDLIAFELDYKTNYVLTLGTALFNENSGSTKSKSNWVNNRKDSYFGSVTHFIKSVFNNKLNEEGFDVKRLIRKENEEYVKFKENLLFDKYIKGPVPPKIISILINQPVPLDSIRKIDKNQQYLSFKGLYSIEYKNALVDDEYTRQFNQKLKSNQLSVISLTDDITIEDNGMYYHPSNLIVEGYFSWRKIANLLPINYDIKKEP